MHKATVSIPLQFNVLGAPLPDSPHAASVALPRWEHVVGYEESEPAVLAAMRAGYPRFLLNPKVVDLIASLGLQNPMPEWRGLVFPSAKVASACMAFVAGQAGQSGISTPALQTGAVPVWFPPEAYAAAFSYWQHTGNILSSRWASAILENRAECPGPSDAKAELRARIADLAGVAADDVYLFSTGMAAITAAHQGILNLRPGLRSLQFGFPYVDTLKLQQKMGPGCDFQPSGQLGELRQTLAQKPAPGWSAVFCECPANPLMTTPDLQALADLLGPLGIPLIVDNTLDSFSQHRVFPEADIAVTSLTKYFSGGGDVMGGCLILNHQSTHYDGFKGFLAQQFEDLLWEEDARVLAENSRDFPARMARIQATTRYLQYKLASCPEVAHLHTITPVNNHPGQHAGGAIFSLVLKNAAEATPAFYDALALPKGPSLGTNFTLVCPYTFLAHYRELDWAANLGISPWLIRISPGLEHHEALWSAIRTALDAVTHLACSQPPLG